MGKCRLPTVKQLVEKKVISGPKQEPVWVYIEKEMRINIRRKPYNEKVGKWLKFLRDLKFHYYCQKKRQLRILRREIGPPWYVELASFQREILGYLPNTIKKDLFGGYPKRTRRALSGLGVTYFIPTKVLLNAMANCDNDPAIFIWNLYSAIYKQPPSKLRGEYDISAMILLSALVIIDLKECIECLEKLTAVEKKPIVIPVTKKPRYYEPDVKFGVYLQRMYAPFYCTFPDPDQPKRGPPPLECKIKFRSEESYERLCMDTKFLELRMKRNRKQVLTERICTYKFWKKPVPRTGLEKKARATHIGPNANEQCCVGLVAIAGSRPRYLLNSFCYIPSGYTIINSGVVCLKSGQMLWLIAGHWITETETAARCESTCSCLEKWETAIMNYVRDQKCMCNHLYDFNRSGKVPDTYFNPPTRHRQYYLDNAKIYQEDRMEDFIKQTCFKAAGPQGEVSTVPSGSIEPAGLKESELLASFLGDLSYTPLIIPHLPQANKLYNLQAWVRRRVKGRIDSELHRRMLVRSMRRWLWLKHMDFKMRAYRIPFTQKQRQIMNWSHKPRWFDKLFNFMLDNFINRNRVRQLEQTRLWWSTMQYDLYPVPNTFRDVYFTYMPAKMNDTHILNPFDSELTPKYGAKTCGLDIWLPVQ